MAVVNRPKPEVTIDQVASFRNGLGVLAGLCEINSAHVYSFGVTDVWIGRKWRIIRQLEHNKARIRALVEDCDLAGWQLEVCRMFYSNYQSTIGLCQEHIRRAETLRASQYILDSALSSEDEKDD